MLDLIHRKKDFTYREYNIPFKIHKTDQLFLNHFVVPCLMCLLKYILKEIVFRDD